MKETMMETAVTYTLVHEGSFYVIEHVLCSRDGRAHPCPDQEQEGAGPDGQHAGLRVRLDGTLSGVPEVPPHFCLRPPPVSLLHPPSP